jgi:integrase
MASIRRLHTTDGIRYEVRWRPAPGQAERSRRFSAHESAKAFKVQTEAAQSRGVAFDPSGGRIPFRRYAEQWLAGRSLAMTTRDNYTDTLERHVYPTFGATPIGKLTPDEIRRWHRPLRERIPSTASRAYRIMHAILATAVDDDLIPRNPCRIRGAGSDPHTERPFVPAEVVLALADIGHARIRPIILVAGFAGLRYGELRALRLRHYDRLHGTLTVHESIDKRSRRKATKTDSSQRTVTLPRFVLDAIDDHLVAFVSGDPNAPLFPGEAGGIISDGWFQREWRAARAALGLTEVHFHDLRHAAGTIATQQGATMREVMARLGHSTTSAAIRYQKAAADRDRSLAERLDQLVEGLRTSANESESGPDPAPRPAAAAGFSRGARLSRERQLGPKTSESPARAGDSTEHPQRDSNPCRHLERVVS